MVVVKEEIYREVVGVSTEVLLADKSPERFSLIGFFPFLKEFLVEDVRLIKGMCARGVLQKGMGN